jgi:hypothetical protein
VEKVSGSISNPNICCGEERVRVSVVSELYVPMIFGVELSLLGGAPRSTNRHPEQYGHPDLSKD